MKRQLLIFGYGYVGQYLSQAAALAGWNVTATSRTPLMHNVTSEAIQLIDFNDKTAVTSKIQTADAILSTVPPDESGEDAVLADCLQSMVSKPWIGYLSSTGVYGDHQGAWVDETTICQPKHPRTRRRLAVESRWMAQYDAQQWPVHIFRLGGIYGPKRNPCHALQQGRKKFTIYAPHHFFSRIHVSDIVQALMCSIQQPTPGAYYNVVDNQPTPAFTVDEFAAHLLNTTLPRIPLAQATLSPMAKSFYEANRRVSSQKIQKALDVQWHYPDFERGLREGCTADWAR